MIRGKSLILAGFQVAPRSDRRAFLFSDLGQQIAAPSPIFAFLDLASGLFACVELLEVVV